MIARRRRGFELRSACFWLVGAFCSASLASAAPAEDGSLTPAEFVRAGVPDASRPWSAAEMAAAAKALATVAEQGAGRLPRHDSARSGVLFARITARDNLDPYRLPSAPLDGRMGPALDFQVAANTVYKLYLSHAASEGTYRREVVELTGLMLRTTVVLQGLLKELIPTLKKDDPTYLTRMRGLQQARGGMATLVASSLGMLGDASLGEHGRRLIALMEETLPAILAELPIPQRDELVALIEKVAHPDLGPLREKVRIAVRNAPADVGGASIDDLQKSGVTMHRVQAGEPDTSGWCLARSTRGGFSVQLPGRFNDFSVVEPGNASIAMHTVSAQTLLGAKFRAMRSPLPKAGAATGQADFLEGLAAEWTRQGKTVRRRAVPIAGQTGGELAVSGGGTAAVFRLLTTKDAVYQMIVEYPEPLEGTMAADAKRFFESFRLD